jgi:hypothetical protein
VQLLAVLLVELSSGEELVYQMVLRFHSVVACSRVVMFRLAAAELDLSSFGPLLWMVTLDRYILQLEFLVKVALEKS